MSLYQNIRKHKLHSTVNKKDICTVVHPGMFGGPKGSYTASDSIMSKMTLSWIC